MTELVLSAPQVRLRDPSSATSVFEEPVPEVYCSYEVSSAFDIADVQYKTGGAPVVARPVLVKRIAESGPTSVALVVSWSWPEARETAISYEPLVGSKGEPLEARIEAATVLEEIYDISRPYYSRLEAIRKRGRWLSSAMALFPGLRSMTAEEAAAYRAFTRRISRRMRIVKR